MSKKIFELRYIFGLKLKELRQSQQLTYQTLSEKSGLSVSYLSEIETGKKYPKGDKISQLAEALGVPYDELVSIQVPEKLKPIIHVIESDLMKHFPLEEFGLNPQKVVEVVSQDPYKINAFIETILQISRAYELTSSKFFSAALKAYQELHNSYFEDIEEDVQTVHLEFTELADVPFTPKEVEGVLLKLGVRIDYERLPGNDLLKDIRSLYHPDQRLLMINQGLTQGQQNFIMGREIAFQWMRLKNRPATTPRTGEFGFDEALNDFKASYFSAALLMPRSQVLEDIQNFARLEQWDPQRFIQMASKYEATPEMVMQRLTNLLPQDFGVRKMFFVRIVYTEGVYHIRKEIHLAGSNQPQGNESKEHYCRRWSGIHVIEQLKLQSETSMMTHAQLSRYYGSEDEFFCISTGFTNVSNTKEYISVTVGFLVDRSLKQKAKFIGLDPGIPKVEVNVTCESCPISDCSERVAPGVSLAHRKQKQSVQEAIDRVLKA